MFKLTERVMKQEMSKIVQLASSGKGVTPSQAALFQSFEAFSNSWQEVLLVTAHDDKKGTTAVVINRPLAIGVGPKLAELLYEIDDKRLDKQKDEAGLDNEGGTMRRSRTVIADAFAADFKEGVINSGGDEDRSSFAMLIHGHDLADSVELAPGTRIYQAGLDAAAKAVREGELNVLDFRLFLGKRTWAPGALGAEIGAGMWQPVACARPLALKQCLQLPKPLWHEVCELTGGRLMELSKLEMLRREDLQDDEEAADEDENEEDEDYSEEEALEEAPRELQHSPRRTGAGGSNSREKRWTLAWRGTRGSA
eukprot:CAMPEP_0182568246 /NCGR_PEP_ID=MMETSP1324-20130603/9254_1 /TAXON_ID=236786 /ORGANISM="Florenciella sp., Strain RCC1587" /LENGTH=309 /DNA_ID=CAMNT_0024782373 /DNA_START=42 /DNA_END=969 /DNA_ORIENTATION=+